MLPGGFAWRLANTGIDPEVAAVALDMFEESGDESEVLAFIYSCGCAEAAHAIRLGLKPRITLVDGEVVRSWF